MITESFSSEKMHDDRALIEPNSGVHYGAAGGGAAHCAQKIFEIINRDLLRENQEAAWFGALSKQILGATVLYGQSELRPRYARS